MGYDEWKLRTPPRGNPVDLNPKCKCGATKYLADVFCADCRKEWERRFKKNK